MMTSKKLILIDDDSSNNYMCCQVLKKLCSPVVANIYSFTLVEKGLLHLKTELSNQDNQVILFLDINMPSQLSGWEVLDRISTWPQPMQNRLVIFMLSSSDRTLEKAKALGYRLVRKFIQKPMLTSMTWLKTEVLFDDAEVLQPSQQNELPAINRNILLNNIKLNTDLQVSDPCITRF